MEGDRKVGLDGGRDGARCPLDGLAQDAPATARRPLDGLAQDAPATARHPLDGL